MLQGYVLWLMDISDCQCNIFYYEVIMTTTDKGNTNSSTSSTGNSSGSSSNSGTKSGSTNTSTKGSNNPTGINGSHNSGTSHTSGSSLGMGSSGVSLHILSMLRDELNSVLDRSNNSGQSNSAQHREYADTDTGSHGGNSSKTSDDSKYS
jgi:hypothetical protein